MASLLLCIAGAAKRRTVHSLDCREILTVAIEPPTRRSLRCGCTRAWLWLLLLALPLYGTNSALLVSLGPIHRHAGSAAEAPWLTTLRSGVAAIEGALHAQSRLHAWSSHARAAHTHEADALPGHVHRHTHGGFERHHHDSIDTTLVSLGDAAASDDAARAAMGSVMLLAALPTSTMHQGTAPAAAGRWPRRYVAAWSSFTPARIERPPRMG